MLTHRRAKANGAARRVKFWEATASTRWNERAASLLGLACRRPTDRQRPAECSRILLAQSGGPPAEAGKERSTIRRWRPRWVEIGGSAQQLLPARRSNARSPVGRRPGGARMAWCQERGCAVRRSDRPCGGRCGACPSRDRQLPRDVTRSATSRARLLGFEPRRDRALAPWSAAVLPHHPRSDPSGSAAGVRFTDVPRCPRGNPHDLGYAHAGAGLDRTDVGHVDAAVHDRIAKSRRRSAIVEHHRTEREAARILAYANAAAFDAQVRASMPSSRTGSSDLTGRPGHHASDRASKPPVIRRRISASRARSCPF